MNGQASKYIKGMGLKNSHNKTARIRTFIYNIDIDIYFDETFKFFFLHIKSGTKYLNNFIHHRINLIKEIH